MNTETTVAAIEQYGKTNVTFTEILEAFRKAKEQQAIVECFTLIRTHAIVLPPEPSFILGPLGPGR